MGNQQQPTRAAPSQRVKPGLAASLEIKDRGDVHTITINVGEDLDDGANNLFTKAIIEAQHDVGTLIVVNMANTRRIFDSGLALLKLLNERSWRRTNKIRIINCRPDLECRFAHGLNPGIFDLSDDCLLLEIPH
jgi:anti-anti-sigma regulatory factor